MGNYKSLTIQQARAILKIDESGVSDAELKDNIEVATLLKDIFFDNLINKKLKNHNAKTKPL